MPGGESGAGKSTLALAIMGLLPDTATVPAGRIVFDGMDLLRAGQTHLRRIRGKDISLVFQDAQAALNPVQPVGQQLEEVILAHSNTSRRAATGMSLEILRELGLPRTHPHYEPVPLCPQRRDVPAGHAGHRPGYAPQAAHRRRGHVRVWT